MMSTSSLRSRLRLCVPKSAPTSGIFERSGTPSEPQQQLGLFQVVSADPAAEKLAQRLRETDPNNLTPLQALSLLAELKKELE